MKRCPACSRVYDDVSLRFCLDDGTALVNKLPESGPPVTALLPASSDKLAATIENLKLLLLGNESIKKPRCKERGLKI